MTDFEIHSVSREKILEMVKEEQNVRYSKGIQEAYTKQFYALKENNYYERVNIEQEIQKYILRKHGFKDDKNSINQYWKIPATYWNDEKIKNNLFYMKLNIFKYPDVKIGDNMIDTQMIDYKTNNLVSLSSLETPNKPLVILAGSMTWPPFRISMNAYQRFYDNYSKIANIYILYILEAHFVEKDEKGDFIGGWPIGYQYNYSQHKTIEDRRKMVEVLIDEFHPTIPILMDNMNNDFQNAYNPWPDKAYVFLNGKIKYIARQNDDGSRNTFWTNEIETLITNL